MLKRLKVSQNNRYLVTVDDEPFFWLGDTAWELFHRLSKEDALLYLTQRHQQGFTVIQAVILAELDGLLTPNGHGETPFENLDPSRPNEKYFAHVDWVIEQASQLEQYIALLPTWGDKVDKRYDWAKGPEIFNEQSALRYGRYLGARYQKYSNIVWVLGGDRDPDDKAVMIWRSLAQGLKEGLGNINALMTFHPQPFGSGSSSRWFHHDDWLSFNMLQTGHDKQKNTFDQIYHDYSLIPTKPVIDGEPTYEAHGLSFKPTENGYSSDYEVRKFAYWSVFSGAFGHTYGCHSVWQFYSAERDGINSPIYDWRDALHLAGANQMRHLRRLILSKSFLTRIPDQNLIPNRNTNSAEYIVATRDEIGSYAFIYTPIGKPFDINTSKLAGNLMSYCWYNPKDGSTTIKTICTKTETLSFTPPSIGEERDWVLILEQADNV